MRASQVRETEQHIQDFLDTRPSEEKPHVPGVFEPSREETELKARYTAEQRLEQFVLDADPDALFDTARDFRVTKEQRVSLAWLRTHRAVQVYRDEASAQADTERVRALEERGWQLMKVTRDRDLRPENEVATRDAVIRWGRAEDARGAPVPGQLSTDQKQPTEHTGVIPYWNDPNKEAQL